MRKVVFVKSAAFVQLVILILLASAGSAQAQDRTVIGSMSVDCSTLAGEALQYAQDNDICSESGDATTGGVTGAGTSTSSGKCGTVSLTVENWPAPDQAIMSMKAVSSVGMITQLSYNIAWRNNDTGKVGVQTGGTPIHASSVYKSPIHLAITGRGIIRGVLNGQATVNALLACTINPTIAYGAVS